MFGHKNKNYRHISPSGATWYHLEYAYSFSISLFGVPAWLYSALPQIKGGYLLANGFKTNSVHTDGILQHDMNQQF